MTRLRFTTTETAIGPAGALVWEAGSAGAVVVTAGPTSGPSWTASRRRRPIVDRWRASRAVLTDLRNPPRNPA